MANKDIFVRFPFFCFPKQSKKRKNGIYLWAVSVFRFFRFYSQRASRMNAQLQTFIKYFIHRFDFSIMK